jgi:hypothetical protein
MAVIILIRRVVRADQVDAFREHYVAERPTHAGFIAEYLTEIDTREDLPPALRSLSLAAPDGVTFVNVAIWRSAEDFEEHFAPRTLHNPDLELADRVRVVLKVRDGVGDLSPALLGLLS